MQPKSSESSLNKDNKEAFSALQLTYPHNGQMFACGEETDLIFKKNADTIKIDSIKVSVNGVQQQTIGINKLSSKIKLPENKTGFTPIEYTVFIGGVKKQSNIINVKLLSDIVPQKKQYKIVKTYLHSTEAYTQGLIFENGFFYESDGEYGKSALRLVKLENGETLNNSALSNTYFAEGIAILNNEIYQLTWRERTCFVYDKKSFAQKRTINYTINEGWGLTTANNKLLMTDGSNFLYTIEPSTFDLISKVEVYDNVGPVDKLNELEYVNGLVYANIYTTDKIVIINPTSGKVVEYLDMNGLLKPSDKKPDTDVLNGIAYNPNNGHFYVTGKNWPKLFEIEIY
jgi:glutamine cyclotransferase